MDPQNLPAPVFIRGYVVQMSKMLGLDEKKVADSYMKVLKANTSLK
jgi:cytoskeletal protein RodZ